MNNVHRDKCPKLKVLQCTWSCEKLCFAHKSVYGTWVFVLFSLKIDILIGIVEND